MIRVEIEISASGGDLKIGKRSFFVTPPTTEAFGCSESGLAAAMENCIDIMLAELQPPDSKIIQAKTIPESLKGEQ